MDAFEILVIILSITLAIFLIVAIVAGIALTRLLKKAEIIAGRVDHVASNIESASERFKQAAAPAGIISFITKMMHNHHK